MKTLLNNRFAPITDSWGFLEAPFDQVVDAFRIWYDKLHAPNLEFSSFAADLSTALQSLEPLNQATDLIMETTSKWTALFSGSPGGGGSRGNYVSKQILCRGLDICCVENTFSSKNVMGIPGAVQFIFWKGEDLPEEERFISASNQCEAGWDWTIHGNLQSFENPAYYQARRVRDRFTDEILEEYCAALGIDLFNENFYGPRCAVLRRPLSAVPGEPPLTYEALQKAKGLR